MTHSNTAFFSSPSSDLIVVFTDAPQPQQAYISLHKNNQLNAEERRKLLSIMTLASIYQLRNEYLTELEAALNHLDAVHHPAVIPGRQIIAEIRRNDSSDATILEILHYTLKLAATPADSHDFQQTAADYLQTSRNVNAQANGSYLVAACSAFAAACTIAVAITLGVMMGSIAATDIILSTLMYGLMGLVGLGFGLTSAGLFKDAHSMKKITRNMLEFEGAMHQVPASEVAPAPKI